MKNKILITLAIISIIILLMDCEIDLVIIMFKIVALIYLIILTKANNYFYQGE